ncbi:hypothetical protein EN35_06410 [Rhodococcus qingshengii]|nr:hypothetical protein EN35_06410 [Rhodococcus qingshengii]
MVCMPFEEGAEYKHPIQRVTLRLRLRGAQQPDDAARRRTVTGVGFLPRAQLCSKAPDNVGHRLVHRRTKRFDGFLHVLR